MRRCQAISMNLWKKLPVGSYKVYRAYVPGDENGNQYSLIVSDSSIEIEEDRIKELIVWRATDVKTGQEKKEKVPLKKSEPQQSLASEDRAVVVCIGIGVLIIFILGVIAQKKFLNHDRCQ